jgi:hypothetical protein
MWSVNYLANRIILSIEKLNPMKTQKQKIALFLKGLGIFLISALLLLFIFRDTLLQKAITKVIAKCDQDYHCYLTIKKVSFDGLSVVEIQNIVLKPKQADTLLSIEKIKTKINLLQLITGDIQLEGLELKNGYIQLIKNRKGRNFDVFFPKEKKKDHSEEKGNYAELAYRLLSKVLNLVPTDMHLENLSLRLEDMGRKVTFKMNQLQLKEQQLQTTIQVNANNFSQNWNIKGFADPRNRIADLKFFNSDTTKIKVPYLEERYNLLSSFDSIRVNVSKIEMESGELHINGFASIVNLTINHPKIAKKEVVVKRARFDYRFLFGEHFMAIDSSSTLQMNAIKLHPFASYSTEEDTVYSLKMRIPKMKAQEFVTSLPQGLFSHFEGMEIEGNFAYDLNYKYIKNKPNQLVFESKLKKENLRILKYGQANLAKLNSEFTYRAIENEVPQRPIVVGISNPLFTPLDRISPYLQKCVLTSEDPSFFSHRGFINEAFKQSILKNIRTKKFSRGASTISMQLVKNVFLTREKTLSRKLEEILLVYILENNRIASKQRMLEVYFNVIEWGPNVYGIAEASQFYFNKKPLDLNLRECLFLAAIVPKPKKFMYQFDSEGFLKSRANKQQSFIRNLMLRRGLITSEDTVGQSIPLPLLGNARTYLKIKVQDSIPMDSLFTIDMNMIQ